MADEVTGPATATPEGTTAGKSAAKSIPAQNDDGSFEAAMLADFGAPGAEREEPTGREAGAGDDDDDSPETAADVTDESDVEPAPAKAAGDDTKAETEEGDEESAPDEEEAPDPEEDEDSAAEDEDDEEGLPKGLEKLPKGLRKRFEKLWRKNKEQKGEIESLQSRPVPLNPSEKAVLTDVTTDEELDSKVELANRILEWCQENPKGAILEDAQGNEVEIDAAGVAKRKELAKAILKQEPARREYLLKHPAAQRVARQKYPQLFVKGSEWERAKAQMLKEVPELVKLWDLDLFIGHYLRGLREDLEETQGKARYTRVELGKRPAQAGKGAGGGAQSKPRTPAPPSGQRPGGKLATKGPDIETLAKRYDETGTEEDFARLVAAETAA